jgi:hypothetical protein
MAVKMKQNKIYQVFYRFSLAKLAWNHGMFGFCGYSKDEILSYTVISDDEVKAEFKAYRRLKEKYKKFIEEYEITDIEIEYVKDLGIAPEEYQTKEI